MALLAKQPKTVGGWSLVPPKKKPPGTWEAIGTGVQTGGSADLWGGTGGASALGAAGPAAGSTPFTVKTTPGYWKQPDWKSLIASDPTLMGSIGTIAAAGAAAGRERMNAVRRAIVQAGFVPANMQGEYWKNITGDIDEATRLAAAQNPLSTQKMLAEQRSQSQVDLAAELAGRGILQSGGLGAGQQVIQTGFERAQAQATQELLDALAGYESSYSAAQRDLALQELQLKEAAASRVMGANPPTWVEPVEDIDWGSAVPAAPTWTPSAPGPTLTPGLKPPPPISKPGTKFGNWTLLPPPKKKPKPISGWSLA